MSAHSRGRKARKERRRKVRKVLAGGFFLGTEIAERLHVVLGMLGAKLTGDAYAELLSIVDKLDPPTMDAPELPGEKRARLDGMTPEERHELAELVEQGPAVEHSHRTEHPQ